MNTKPLIAKSLIAVLLSMAGIGYGAAASAKTIHAVTSFTILADVVKNVGGEHVKVKSLVPPNGDPHDFSPSPEDAKALKTADATFVSGLGLETWFARLAKAAGVGGQPIDASHGVKTHTMDEEGRQVIDPHVWNSVPNVLVWVHNIEAALAKADPSDAAAFHVNARRYAEKLKALDARIHARVQAVPKEKRKVLTSHDAFGYYAREYGVRFLAPVGLSTEQEPSAADVANLIDQIKRDHIKVYFIENSTDSRLVRQIAKATGAEPGGELYPEALSPANGPASTYIALMKHNTDLIVSAISR